MTTFLLKSYNVPMIAGAFEHVKLWRQNSDQRSLLQAKCLKERVTITTIAHSSFKGTFVSISGKLRPNRAIC